MLTKSLTVRGFIQSEFTKSHGRDFVRDMSAWVADGSVRYREDVVDGLEAAPEAFRGLLTGRNFGKLLVRVSEDPTRLTGPDIARNRVRGRQTRTRTTEEASMPKAWNAKRERQYEHIKEGLEDKGRSEDTAEEIAARTVNKERARAGEAKEKSKTSTDDISSGRRGGLRSHKGSGGRTKAAALRRGEEEEHRGPLVDEQGRAGEGRRPLTSSHPA